MTPAQKKVLAHIRENGPVTTLGLIQAHLNPRSAVALYADGKLLIGGYGYELPAEDSTRKCGCGCGAEPNAKHEAELMRKYYDRWPGVLGELTAEQLVYCQANQWSLHMPPRVCATRKVTEEQVTVIAELIPEPKARKRPVRGKGARGRKRKVRRTKKVG